MDLDDIVKERREAYKEKRLKSFEQYSPYESPSNIPVITNIDKNLSSGNTRSEPPNTYDTVVKPSLYENGAIPKSSLEHGIKYWGRSKKAYWAIWEGGLVQKFKYVDKEGNWKQMPHFEDVSDNFSFEDMFIPLNQDVQTGDIDSFVNVEIGNKVKKLSLGLEVNGNELTVILYYKGDEISRARCELPTVSGSTTN